MKPIWLVAHDFTAAADAAMMVAAADLDRLKGQLLLTHVYRFPAVAGGLASMANARGLQSWNRMSNRYAVEATEKLDVLAARLRQRYPSLDVQARTIEGAVVSGILRAAAEAHADRIVVGYAPGAGLRRRLKGSISERLVKDASLPVLVVKASS